jgi:hypothetical protein
MTKEDHDKKVGDIARSWWNGLRPVHGQNGRRGGDSGALARLRRGDLLDAAMEEVTIDLFHRLERYVTIKRQILVERAALIAAVLSHVRDDDHPKVAVAAGEKIGTDQRLLHPLRNNYRLTPVGS